MSGNAEKRARAQGADSLAHGAAAPPAFVSCADSPLGELLLDVIGLVAARGYAAEVSHCLRLCGLTWRRGDAGATNDMIASSLRLQCGAVEARAARREDFAWGAADSWYSLEADDEDRLVAGSTQLIRATILNNLPRALQLIQLGAPLELADASRERSALGWACALDREHVARALLAGKFAGAGARVDAGPALVAACQRGHESIARLMLLEQGASPDARDADGDWTALIAASASGSEGLVRLLLGRGADVAQLSTLGRSALHAAAGRGRATVLELLLAAPGTDAVLNTRLYGTTTALKNAIDLGHGDCARLLRARGATL